MCRPQNLLLALLCCAPTSRSQCSCRHRACQHRRSDISIAHALYFDEAQSRWIGAASWWTNELIHRDGAWLIAASRRAGAGTLGSHLRCNRSCTNCVGRAVFLSSIVLSVGLVEELLKALTNVDCPRDLTEFGGGGVPYIHLFRGLVPEAFTSRLECFPAAHASSPVTRC